MNEIIFEIAKGFENNNISLPIKGTKQAAGYDFICFEETIIKANSIGMVKTGIKAKFPNNMALLLLNRSSNPKKKGLMLANGVGLVDADYYSNIDNDGHIMFAFYNIRNEDVILNINDKIGQGVFINYYDVSNLNTHNLNERQGGFGSTGK